MIIFVALTLFQRCLNAHFSHFKRHAGALFPIAIAFCDVYCQ